jgi:hypothetical protein
MELEPVSALLTNRGTPSPSFKPGKSDQEVIFRAVKLITGGVLFFFLGGIVSAAGNRLFHREDITSLGVFFLIFGAFLAAFALFQGLWARTKPRPEARTDAKTQPDLKSPLGEAPPPVIPSITGSTTRMIDPRQSLRSESQTSSQQAD